MQTRTIFITGTDTGIGKTLLTGLMLLHLRQSGGHALAMKPFCSGGTADLEVLHALQDGELTRDEINPFYFAEPVAPLVATRKHRRRICLDDVLTSIHTVASRHLAGIKNQKSKIKNPTLLIEGSGGLLVPLGEGFTVADLIKKLGCEVIVVSRNRLGTINHTLLTVKSLQSIGIQHIKIVLLNAFPPRHSTPDTRHNARILAELLDPVRLISLPFLGQDALGLEALKRNAKKCKKTLAQILC
jgi:dethiobiotin synthetase